MSAGSGGGNLGSAVGFVALDVSRLSRGVAEGTRQLHQLENAGETSARNMQKIGLAAAGLGASLSLGIGFAVKAFASFDGQMAGVAASLGGVGTAAGVTEEQFAGLRKAALQIGADTSKSATEAALAMELMAKAGVGVEDILNGAAAAAVNISEATGDSLAQSAETMSAFLLLFKETGITAEEVADIIVTGMNASSASMSEFQTGVANLAPVIKALNIGFDEASAAIAFFNAQGLSAARVGTDLSAAMLRLVNPPKDAADEMERLGIAAFDLKGEFIGFPALFDQLNRATRDMTSEQKLASLSLIFSAGALDTMAVAAEAGGSGIEALTADMSIGGSAAAAAATRMDSFAGALEEMQGSIEGAAIALGAAMAPALTLVAGQVQRTANAFSALPAPVQQTAAAAIAAAAGLSLSVAAIAQTGSFAATAATRIVAFSRAIIAARAASALLSLALGPIGLLIAGIAAATYLVIRAHQDHQRKVKDLDQAYKDLNETVQQFKLQGLTQEAADTAESLNLLEASSQAVEEQLASLKTEYADLVNQMQQALPPVGAERQRIEERIAAINKEIDAYGELSVVVAQAGEIINDAMTQPGVDTTAIRDEVANLTIAWATGELTGEQYLERLTGIRENIGDYVEVSGEATQATDDLADAETGAAEASEEAAEAQEKFNQQLAETEEAALNAVRGIEDIAPELDGLQAGFGRVGDDIGDVLLKMGELGALDLDPTIQEALNLQNALQDVEEDILRVESAIQNNADDMSMWQGRIDLVNETLGTEENALEHLDELLANNSISQAEYNKIKEAGAFIIERSVGGLEDERLEQARQLPILAEYIRQHDAADGAVNNLTAAQQGFIAAMGTSQVQTALQTIQLLAYLAAMGLIPPEKVTEFIADVADADPIVAAFLEDLGLIPPKKNTDIETTLTGASVDDFATLVGGLPANVGIEINTTLTGPSVGDALVGGLPAAPPTLQIATELTQPPPITVDPQGAADIPTKLEQPDPIDVAAMDPVEIPVTVSDEGVEAALAEIDAALTKIDRTVTPHIDISTDLVLTATGNVLDELDAIDLADAEATIDADNTLFFDSAGAARKEGEDFDVTDYEATLDGDNTLFFDSAGAARREGESFAEADYEATLSADNSGAFVALNSILLAVGFGWSGRVFSASLSLNTSGAIAAAQSAAATIAAFLPQSPAKVGPLSEEPSFQYIPDAFAVAMAAMVGIAERRLSDVDQAFADHHRSFAMANLIDGGSLQSFGRTSLRPLVPTFDRQNARGGDVHIHNYQLKSQELIKLIDNAQKGGNLYDAAASELTIRRR